MVSVRQATHLQASSIVHGFNLCLKRPLRLLGSYKSPFNEGDGLIQLETVELLDQY